MHSPSIMPGFMSLNQHALTYEANDALTEHQRGLGSRTAGTVTKEHIFKTWKINHFS